MDGLGAISRVAIAKSQRDGRLQSRAAARRQATPPMTESAREPVYLPTKTAMLCATRALLMVAACCALPVHALAQGVVARLIVAPISLRLEPGTARDVVAEAYDEGGAVIAAERAGIVYASSDTGIVVVSPTGTALGVRSGRAEIIVKAGTQTRRVSVTVGGSTSGNGSVPGSETQPGLGSTPTAEVVPAGPAVVSALIQPGNIQLLPTERLRPTFRLRFADGTTADANDVVWNAFGSSIGFDAATGDVIGVTPGSGVLGGRYGQSITASVPVTIGEVNFVPDHDSVLLVAGAVDTVRLLVPAQARREVTQNLSWRTTDPSVLRVLNPATGIVQARDGGTADLIVDGYGVTRRIFVRVTPRVARIEAAIAPGTQVTLPAGGAVTLDAKPIGSAGTQLTAVTLTWRIADTAVARVNARGQIIGIHEGTTNVFLEAPGLEQTAWPVTVVAAHIALSAKSIALQTGSLKPLTAPLRGQDRREYGVAENPQWTSSAPAIASVDGSGTISARNPGRATITVTQRGAGVDSMTIFVTGRTLIAGTIGADRGVWQLLGASDTVPALLVAADSGTITQATWSPDRTRIAATIEPTERSALSRVVVMDADGTNQRTISPDLVAASDPSWAPDGSAVLIAVRDAKVSAILRVALAGGTPTTLVAITDGRVRHPVPTADTGAVIVRMEKGGAIDLARIRAGSLQLLTTSKPREELIAPLRDGRLLIAIDSGARSRPATLQWITVAADGIEIATAVPIPAGLVVTDIAAGYDDGTALVVARARSWPGVSGAALVVLRVSLDGGPPRVLLLLGEKDAVTVRSD